MPEYADESNDRVVSTFRTLDHNDDGLISPEESHSAPIPAGAIGFANDVARVLQPGHEVVSEIWISDDIDIQDIDVRVAITKQDDFQLSLVLIGAEGQRVKLFLGGWQPWPPPYIFESTLVDDEAPLIVKTLAQPHTQGYFVRTG